MATFSKEESKEYIYKNLGKSDSNIDKLFDSMKDVYIISALLGAIEGKRKPIEKKSKDVIKDVYFEEDDKLLMDIIALQDTKDIHILNRKEEANNYIHLAIEEYGNYGIDILDDLIKHEHFNLDNLIACVKNYEKIEKPKKIELEDLILEVNSSHK